MRSRKRPAARRRSADPSRSRPAARRTTGARSARERRCRPGVLSGRGAKRGGQIMTESELAGLRVLVIEDEALVSMLLEDVLAELGCEVVGFAARYADALAKSTSLDYDV